MADDHSPNEADADVVVEDVADEPGTDRRVQRDGYQRVEESVGVRQKIQFVDKSSASIGFGQLFD